MRMGREEIYQTSLEKETENILNELSVKYSSQYSVRSGFIIDFAVIDKKIAIEVDGEKWHSSKEAMKHDRFKDYMLKRKGWKVIRLKENEKENWKELLSSINRDE